MELDYYRGLNLAFYLLPDNAAPQRPNCYTDAMANTIERPGATTLRGNPMTLIVPTSK